MLWGSLPGILQVIRRFVQLAAKSTGLKRILAQEQIHPVRGEKRYLSPIQGAKNKNGCPCILSI
jgi:hypothetical protein